MKKSIILSILVLTFNSVVNGQESKKYLKLKANNYRYQEGYVVYHDSTVREGLVKYNFISEAKKHSVVIFFGTDGVKRTYHPYELKSYGYTRHKFVSDNRSFYEIVQAGEKVSLYKLVVVSTYSTGAPPGMGASSFSSESENLYVKRPDEKEFKYVRKKKFKEEFSKYFEDCEILRDEIKSGSITHKNIKSIVIKYNNCH
ncbi:MAG: hypothetical protein ABFS32_14830 [Bacteroidota bacterium]